MYWLLCIFRVLLVLRFIFWDNYKTNGFEMLINWCLIVHVDQVVGKLPRCTVLLKRTLPYGLYIRAYFILYNKDEGIKLLEMFLEMSPNVNVPVHWNGVALWISKKDVYSNSCFMQKDTKQAEVTETKRKTRQRMKLITKKKRTKEQRGRITRCESPSPRLVKKRTTKWSKQLVIRSVKVLKSPMIMLRPNPPTKKKICNWGTWFLLCCMDFIRALSIKSDIILTWLTELLIMLVAIATSRWPT